MPDSVVEATASLVHFQQYEGERSLNSDDQARLELLFNRIKPFVEASFLSSRQRPGYEIDARAQRQETGARAGGRIRLAGETWLELTVHRSRVSFDPEAEFLGTSLREVLNRDVDRASAGIRYPLTPLTTIVLLADTQRDRFALSPTRDSKSLRILPGIEFDSRALISGRAYVGYHRFDAPGTGVPGYRGVYASVDLAYAMLGSTKFSARAERDVNYSFEILQPVLPAHGCQRISVSGNCSALGSPNDMGSPTTRLSSRHPRQHGWTCGSRSAIWCRPWISNQPRHARWR